MSADATGTTIVAPYGSWPSSITTQVLMHGSVSLSNPQLDGPATYWLEGRAAEQGRVVLVRHTPEGGTADVLPAPFSARSRVHEYGGGEYAVQHGTVVFVHDCDQRIYRLDVSGQPIPITPETADRRVRYGGLALVGNRVFAVRETHHDNREPDHQEPVNEIVLLALGGPNPDGGAVLYAGSDFVGAPAVSPDGTEIAFVAWNHPNMPWDDTTLYRARVMTDYLVDLRRVAGAAQESVAAPLFGPDGALWFASDRTGWWNLYRDDYPVHRRDADMCGAPWQLGNAEYAVLQHGSVVVRYLDPAGAELWRLDPTGAGEHALDAADFASATRLPGDASAFTGLRGAGDDLVVVAGYPDAAPAVVRLDRDGSHVRILRSAASAALDPGSISRPEPRTWTNSGGSQVHGLLFRPRSSAAIAAQQERPPLILMAHGGPTGYTDPVLNLTVQFWTTRGFAVLHVNYTGSAGFGRAYREALYRHWGEVDVDDCITGAQALAAAGLVDGTRMAIRGGSAGGYTVLRALTTSTVFTAGASYYGIGDLEALAGDTHKFESRYLDQLIGPYPQEQHTYRDRSPIHHVDQLSAAMILLQGADDLVVPPNQAEAMAAAVRAKGLPVELLIFPGEGHGFRQAATIERATQAELGFYGRVFGFEPADRARS